MRFLWAVLRAVTEVSAGADEHREAAMIVLTQSVGTITY